MSADRWVICPACYSRETGKAISDITAEDLDYGEEGELAEHYEFYIDDGHVVVDYEADCSECDYRIEFEYKHPLPEGDTDGKR